MHYKKFFSATALVTLLSLSNAAFSDPVGPIADEETSYHIRLQYNGEFLPFKTKIDGITYKEGGEAKDPLKASFIAGGGAFGYKMDNIRVDIEGLYSQLSKNDVAGTISDPEKVADKLSVISGLVNVHYDIAIEDMPITPYLGFGVGAAYVSNPATEKVVADQKHGFGFAYQAKVGGSYDLTPEIKLFAGARYFGSYGAHFDKSEEVAKASGEKETKVTKDVYKVLYSTIGAEAGVAFHF